MCWALILPTKHKKRDEEKHIEQALKLTKIIELVHVHLFYYFFYLAVNKLTYTEQKTFFIW